MKWPKPPGFWQSLLFQDGDPFNTFLAWCGLLTAAWLLWGAWKDGRRDMLVSLAIVAVFIAAGLYLVPALLGE